MRKLLIIVLFCISVALQAQKPALDHSVYDNWKTTGQLLITDDGKWVTYVITPQQGDGWLYICNLTTGRKDSVERGTNAKFSPDSKYLAYQVTPSFSETRQAKKKKLKDEQLPKNSLAIRTLLSGETIIIPDVKSFALSSENSYWMAYLLEKKTGEKKDGKAQPDSIANPAPLKKNGSKAPDPKGTELVLINPVTVKEFRYPDVTEYTAAKDGKTISFVQGIADTAKVENFKVNEIGRASCRERV